MKRLLKKFFNPLTKIENENITFDMGVWKSIGLVLLWQLITLIFVLLTTFTLLLRFKSEGSILSINAVLELATLPIMILIFNKIFGKKTNEINTFKKINKKTIFHVTLLLMSFRLLFNAFILPILMKIPESDSLIQAEQTLNTSIVYAILSACIIAPIIEEVVFRGIILNGMLKRYSPTTAIVISSLIFAIIHGNIHQAVNAFVLALIIGYVFYKTRSIYLAIFCHFINNASAFFLLMPETGIGIIINIIISSLIGITILIYLKKNMNLNYEQHFVSTLPLDENLYSNDEI